MTDNERTDRTPKMHSETQIRKRGEKLLEKSPSSEKADWIGGELRKLYDETVSEPVPDRLLQLLKKLEKDEGEGSPSA